MHQGNSSKYHGTVPSRTLVGEHAANTVHARASAQHEPGVARFIFSFVCSVSWRIFTLLIFLRYFRPRSDLPVFRACAFPGTATTPELEHEEALKAMCEEPELQQQGLGESGTRTMP